LNPADHEILKTTRLNCVIPGLRLTMFQGLTGMLPPGLAVSLAFRDTWQADELNADNG
jgi:hypothetical protein